MSKTKLTPRLPWERAPLGPFEAVVYGYIIESSKELGFVPGLKMIAKKYGCTDLAARSCLASLVRKGWLGEAGERVTELYLNNKPEHLED